MLKKVFGLALCAALFTGSQVQAGEFASREIPTARISKVRVMSNNNMPTKVVVVSSGSTQEFAGNLVETVKKINEEPGYDKISVHIIASSSSMASSLSSRYSSNGYLGNFVEINDQFFTSDQWMQDWGEIMHAYPEGSATPELAIFDSNRGRGLAGLPKILANMWNAHFMKNPSTAGIKGDYGGNIEVTPDNIMVLGNTSTPKLRSFFSENGYKDKLVILETDWLMVGHIDEYITYVPNKNAVGGYTIVKADPLLGLDLIKNATDKEIDEVYSGYRAQIRNMKEFMNSETIVALSDRELESYEFKPEVNVLSAPAGELTDLRAINKMVDINRRIADLIEKNLEILKSEISKRTGVKPEEISVMSMPTVFQGSNSGGKLYSCVAYLPGVVNMLVLRDHAVIPDSQIPLFNRHIEKTSTKIGIKSHFVEDLAYHELAGQIHCGTNVMRKADDYIVKPENLLRKRQSANFEKLFGE